MSCWFVVLSALLAGLALAQAQDQLTININRYPPEPQETICGDIVRANLGTDKQFLFYASEVFDCLTSVSFNDAVALRYLQYINETFQFHAATAFVNHPPPGYQQPPFDFFGSLEATADRVRAGVYHNQYAFETDVQYVIRNLHDTHAFVYAGISSAFSFLSPFRLASVSVDGIQAPKIYVYDDLIAQVTSDNFTASSVSTIDGIDAVNYTNTFASRQSFGMVEPHADWNQLMVSPAQEIFGVSYLSDAAPFYAGDQMTLSFEDGTTVNGSWTALYASPGFTGPLETGGDFYNFFVLGNYPANYDDAYNDYIASQADAAGGSLEDLTLTPGSGDDDNSTTVLTSWHDISPAYPSDTMNYEQDLGAFTNGIVTGYHIAEASTAVLSIPSFEQYGDGIDSFSQSIADFMNNASRLEAHKVIIDLQQNSGGLAALAFLVFDSFFTNERPFVGSRMRSQPDANILGNASTSYFETLPDDPNNYTVQDYEGSEWVVTDRINALTDANFTSWEQYYGPLSYNGDNFSLIQEYDLANKYFLEAAFGIDFESCYYNKSCPTSGPSWGPADIVLLTDGICGSTCSLFVEMMRQQGVRSVAIGGLPSPGPMQAASGSRGATSYSGEELWYDFTATPASAQDFIQPDTGMSGVYTGFTLRDQMQRNETVPNQVLYMPADCRLYWTIANFYNYTRLWQDVHDAMFTAGGNCVAGSTDAAAPVPDISQSQSSEASLGAYITHGLAGHWSSEAPSTNSTFELPFVWDGVPAASFQLCSRPQSPGTQQSCRSRLPECLFMDFHCESCDRQVTCPASGKSPRKFQVCSKVCYSGVGGSDSCGSGGMTRCNYQTHMTSKSNVVGNRGFGGQQQGYCEPVWTQRNQERSCTSISATSLSRFIMGQ